MEFDLLREVRTGVYMQKTLLIGFLLSVSSFSFAGSQLDGNFWNQFLLQQAAEAPKMKEFAQAIPQRLKDKGIDQIGKVNIQKLLKDVKETTFRENTSFIPTQAGSRTSGMYDPKSKTLVINTSAHAVLGYASANDDEPKFRQERLEPILLHETLGSRGVDDRKYDKSLGATILANPPNHLSEEQRVRLKGRIQQQLLAGGGTTTVGGGGDDNSMWIKLKALQLALLADDSFNTFIRILNMNIEMDPTCDHQMLSYVNQKNEIRFCQSSFWFDLRNEDNQIIEISKFVRSFAQINSTAVQP